MLSSSVDYKQKYAGQLQAIKDNYATFAVPYNGEDTVAILGKGAERYQEIKGRKYPFYDIEVVHRFLG